MGYDFLAGKVQDFVKERSQWTDDMEEYLQEKDKVDRLLEGTGSLDMPIREALNEVERDFEAERRQLEAQKRELENLKQKLSGDIRVEWKKVDEGKQKADVLSGKKYTAGVDAISKKCETLLDELDNMLEQLEDETPDSNLVSETQDFQVDTPLRSSLGSGFSLDIGGTHTVAGGGTGSFDGSVDKDRSPSPRASILNVVMTRYPLIEGDHTIEDDLVFTNPNYSRINPFSPYNSNCQRCVMAYEARRRGFDVEAQMLPSEDDPLLYRKLDTGWPSVFEGGELVDCTANSGTAALINVEELVNSWGSNGRGIVRIAYKPECGGGGHVFSVEKVDGQIRFIDPQSNSRDVKEAFSMAKGDSVYCMRVDNLPFTDKIHRCCIKRESRYDALL